MNDDPVLKALADRNPVPVVAPYDAASEARLGELLSTLRTGRKRRSDRARVWFPAVAAATVAVGLVVALFAVHLVVDSHSPARPPWHLNTHSSTPVRVVIDRSAAALKAATRYILRDTSTDYYPASHASPVHKSISWADEGAPAYWHMQDFGSGATLQLDVGQIAENGGYADIEVDYQRHQYTADSPSAPEGPYCCGRTNEADDIAQVLMTTTTVWKLSIRVVDGRTALILSGTGQIQYGTGPTVDEEFWIDPASYLPRRQIVTTEGNTTVSDYTWLPRTDANTRNAFLRLPPVPAGFVKVSRFH